MPPFKPRLDDRGQTAIEYLGILAVVAAIIVVLLTTDFGTTISDAIADQIGRVTGG
ncbi:Flp family type IVb pilin [Streptomyces chumphonensis]|uniref:Flp family type IVb pilin n=1 Tax=Streptomyces chumphonensis TaxID=1214925 RepID=UPI003D7561BD